MCCCALEAVFFPRSTYTASCKLPSHTVDTARGGGVLQLPALARRHVSPRGRGQESDLHLPRSTSSSLNNPFGINDKDFKFSHQRIEWLQARGKGLLIKNSHTRFPFDYDKNVLAQDNLWNPQVEVKRARSSSVTSFCLELILWS